MQDPNHSLKLIAKSSMIIFISVLLSKIFSYIYRVIISRLGPNDYGTLSIALAVFGIIGGLTMLGTETGLVKFISSYDQRKDQIKGVIYDSIRFVLPLSVILSILLFIFADYIAIDFFRNEKLGILLKILAVFAPINALRKIFLNSLIGFKKPQYETIAKAITENLSKVIITAILILLGYQLAGAIMGYVLSILVSLIMAYYFLRYKTFNFFDKSIKEEYSTKEFYEYSLPLLLSIIVFIFILWTDTLLLGYFRNAAEVGIYNAAMPTAQLLFIFPNALMVIFLPVISSIKDLKSEEFAKIFKTVTKWVILINIIPLALFLIYSKQILNIVFGQAYVQGSVTLIILSIGFFLSYSVLASNNILLALNKTKLVFLNNLIAAIANLLLNIILIPRYGIAGAAIATSISFIIMAMLMFSEAYALTRIFPFNLNALKIILSITVPVLIINKIVLMYKINTIQSMVITSVILMVLYASLLIMTKALEKEDYLILNSLYKKIGIRINFVDDLFKRLE